MGFIRNFFTNERILSYLDRPYSWLENLLLGIFGKLPYEPLRDLLINPWFWIILAALVFLVLVFRRR